MEKELNNLYDLVYYQLIKVLYQWNDFKSIERIKNTHLWKNYMEKIDKKDRLKPSGSTGKIMFIGINPGQASKLQNLWTDPFGIFFKKLLDESGISIDDCWMSNLYKKKTPENRPLNDSEIQEGKEELLYEIGFVSPKIIVPMGNQVRDIFNSADGNFKNWKIYTTFGLYHPSYIRRNPNYRSTYIKQLKRIKEFYDDQRVHS